MLAPHAKQRNAMVDFGGFPEPPAGVGATVALDALEKLPVIARGRPQVPRHHEAACQAAFKLGPRCHRSRCQPKRSTGCPHTQQDPAPRAKADSRKGAGGARKLDGRSSRPASPRRHVQPAGAPLRTAKARANRSARIGCARQYESTARRGIAGMNDRCSAWWRTGAGKIAGSALFKRARACRFFAARHSDISVPTLRSPTLRGRRKGCLSGPVRHMDFAAHSACLLRFCRSPHTQG